MQSGVRATVCGMPALPQLSFEMVQSNWLGKLHRQLREHFKFSRQVEPKLYVTSLSQAPIIS